MLAIQDEELRRRIEEIADQFVARIQQHEIAQGWSGVTERLRDIARNVFHDEIRAEARRLVHQGADSLLTKLLGI